MNEHVKRSMKRVTFQAIPAFLVATLAATALAQPLDPARTSAVRKELSRLEFDLGNLEGSLRVMKAEVSNTVAQVRYFPVERRILDADLMFEMKDFEKASTLYRDLADNPDFRSSPGYHRIVFRLGESLFNQRNYVSARRYYRNSATPLAGPFFGQSVARLFEIAVLTGDFQGCEEYESRIQDGMIGSPEVFYSYGKYLYRKGSRDRAAEYFSRVAQGTPMFSRALYFLGMKEATERKLEPALAHFRAAAAVPPTDDAGKDVQVLSILACARVLNEMGKFKEALTVLEEVDPDNARYMDTLLDSAWIYLKVEDFPRAVHALDLLLMNSPAGDIALRASALRGRILTRMNDMEAATEAYKEVSANLTPVTSELERIAGDNAALTAYFQWVMERNSEKFRLEVPISDRTARWVDADPDMARIVTMFSDLAREREDVRESFETVEKLLMALRSGGKIDAFPALKEKVLRLKELEGRFVEAAMTSARIVAEVLKPRLAGDLAARYEAAVESRKAIEARFHKGPKTVQDYMTRERKLSSEYLEVERQLFLVESLLKVERQQVLAIEEWLRDQKFQEGGVRMTPEREAEIRKELDRTKADMSALHEEAGRIRASIERDVVVAQSQTDMLREDDVLRSELIRALRNEAAILKEAGAVVASPLSDIAATGAGVTNRAIEGALGVTPLVLGVQDLADKGAVEFLAIVDRERSSLETATNELQKAEMDARAFAQTEGAAVFRGVKDRLANVLFEADLGIVDMAWQRERDINDALRQLATDRSNKMKGIEAAEQILRQVEAAGAPAPESLQK